MNVSAWKKFAASRGGLVLAASALAAGTAAWVQTRARRAERSNPPRGKFVDVDGVRVHYVERGVGSPVVLLHGNAVSLEDFEVSTLMERLARDHRVIAFDRPGFGHSSRPRDRLWTPVAQAKVLHAAMGALAIDRPVLMGHSMGALVALALALDYPDAVARLVLLGGYYYPTIRVDALMAAPVALPILGDAMRYTVTPLAGRASINGAVKAMFAPMPVPPTFFEVVSREMMLRPVQLRANAEDAAFMMPEASTLAKRYGELRMPIDIYAGAQDPIVDPQAHSVRLHHEVPHSHVVIVPNVGHMVHYAVPEQIVARTFDDAGTNPDRLGRAA
jgi:pimeloyl-ACP methyl ester carboxylesterase